jgi:SAM-dependent methyltransferase
MRPSDLTDLPQARIAAEVQAFYDHYPYPPPRDDLASYRDLWRDPQRRRADFHLFWPARRYREDYSILVAGCGTRQAARHAIRWPSAQVTGIDFSETSVRHTNELKHTYRLDNLHVHHLPLEQIGELGATFDQVVCTGVLHHLADPEAGLRALRAALKPDGAMHLMVYAPYGRTGIYLLQQFCKCIGIPATDRGIQELQDVLRWLPASHPLATLLRDAPDFGTPAALADALLHPQDRAYSVPELLGLLEANDLTFGRWVRQAPYSAHCGAMARIASTVSLAERPLPAQFAAAELFRGTMLRHSAIVYRADGPWRSPQITFTGEAWLNHIPLGLPDTHCVQERLPAGVAGVLRNRAHTYGDTYLPVSVRELRLVEAIDGRRTVAELLGPHAPAQAAHLFERLWWHDQIVFDASRPEAAGGGQ